MTKETIGIINLTTLEMTGGQVTIGSLGMQTLRKSMMHILEL